MLSRAGERGESHSAPASPSRFRLRDRSGAPCARLIGDAGGVLSPVRVSAV